MQTLPLLLILLSSLVSVSSIRCYVCNSLMNKDCEDNYEKTVIYCPVKSFGGKKAVKAIGCRISRQSVKAEKSLIRECAYSGPNVENRSQKGSLGVSRVVTQCEKDLCNPGSMIGPHLILVAFLPLFRL